MGQIGVVEDLVKIEGVTKSYGDRKVLKDVNLAIYAGEFIGLLGHNGAGKSTLVKILDGVIQPDAGQITFGNSAVKSGRPIGVVHQERGTIGELTVFENMRLGFAASRRGPILNRKQEAAQATAALSALNLNVSLDTRLDVLDSATQTLVAVARLCQTQPKLIVLDEVTSTLSAGESAAVIDSLKHGSLTDTAYIMITHKIAEITHLASRIVVLRDGLVVADEKTPVHNLLEMMEGSPRLPWTKTEISTGCATDLSGPILTLDHACSTSAGPIDLAIHAGEAVGVTGRAGGGLEELARVVHGSAPLSSGMRWVAPGVEPALLPSHREVDGQFSELPVQWNVSVSSLRTLSRLGFVIRRRREATQVRASMRQVNVLPDDPQLEQGMLSGGNQQKVVLARLLLLDAALWILCDPTRGVDPKTREEIYSLLRELKQRGTAVLVISADMDDVMAVCDIGYVLKDGHLEQRWETESLTPDDVKTVLLSE